MATSVVEQVMQTVEIVREEEIAAPIDLVFETILEQIGPLNETPEGVAVPMKIEAWPGGRWFRDLGNNSGHFWGHVQAIKPPTLLEICGPLFVSAPAVSNVQYRLMAEGKGTRVRFVHRGIGQLGPGSFDPGKVDVGWTSILTRIRRVAESRTR